MSMRTTIESGSADLLIATQANILPRTFSAGAPHVVVTSTSGSVRPIAIAASNPLRFTPPALLGLLRVRARGVSLREPLLPLLDGLDAAVAAAVGRIHERAVGQPRPSESSAGPSVPHRTIRNGDRGAGLEGAAGDATREQRRRRRALEAPERL